MPIDETSPEQDPGRETQAPTASTKHRHPLKRLIVVVIVLVVVVGAFLLGVWPRKKASNTVRTETDATAVPYVAVSRPERAGPEQEVVLPGDVQAYMSATIFARTSGYLDRWYVDIGARVKRGQLLAVIKVPELEQQLQQARDTLAASEANLRLAEETATRLIGLRKLDAVAQQEVDNAVGVLGINKATVRANQASVRQFTDLLSYTKIRAPFDGVITVRNTDVGDLINAGSTTTPGTDLFQIVQADKLRVFVNVPEAYAPMVKPGLEAELTMAAVPGRTVTGTLVRTAKAIDPTTRTLLAEIEVDNSTGTLFTGAYAEVRLKTPAVREIFIVPVASLLFRKEGLHVATVSDGKVLIKTVTPGHDFGDRIEIVKGIVGDELVIQNPADSIATGQEVRIAQQPAPSQAPSSGAEARK
jgi:RND family efflux transporter MFP subunit